MVKEESMISSAFKSLPILAVVAAGIIGIIIAHAKYGLALPLQNGEESVGVGGLTGLIEFGIVGLTMYLLKDKLKAPDWLAIPTTVAVPLALAYFVIIPFLSYLIPIISRS